jgi:L-fuconolactonase
MRLDAHQHFWSYDPAEYPWITDKLARLRRSYLPEHLEPELRRTGLQGCIAVQARQTLRESEWLLKLATEHAIIKGVVGWVDLRAPGVEQDLSKLAQNPKFVGVRHVAQDEPDDRFLVGREFLRGIARLREFNLAYDILIFPKQLPAAIELVRKFPEQRFVLDHLAKPAIREGTLEPWRSQVCELAQAPNVMCKISGLVTEADWENWRASDFVPYVEASWEFFGEDRLMFGSDWPVCLLAGAYHDVKGIVDGWLAGVSTRAREKVLGLNCARFYGIPASEKA